MKLWTLRSSSTTSNRMAPTPLPPGSILSSGWWPGLGWVSAGAWPSSGGGPGHPDGAARSQPRSGRGRHGQGRPDGDLARDARGPGEQGDGGVGGAALIVPGHAAADREVAVGALEEQLDAAGHGVGEERGLGAREEAAVADLGEGFRRCAE